MDAKQEFLRLKMACMEAVGEREQAEADARLDAFLNGLDEEGREAVRQAVAEDWNGLHTKAEEAETVKKRLDIKKELEEVLPLLSMSGIAKKYFGRSASWLHQRVNGNEVHGKPASFTGEELRRLADSLGDIGRQLSDISSGIRRFAD